jgi:hypothetical protein
MRSDPIQDGFGPVVTRLLEPAALRNLAADWDRLSANALEENALYSRAYVMAGLAHVDADAGLRAFCAFRHRPDGTERLIGLIPLRRTRFRYGIPVPVELGAQNPFQTSGTPLIDREDAEASIDALLTAADKGVGLSRNLLIPNIRVGGPFAQLLKRRIRDVGFEADFIDLLNRPVLRRSDETADAYFSRSVAPKRLRELRRAHRRLCERGALAYHHVSAGSELRLALEDFLRIEAAGWKGEAGTALLSRPETAAFAREAFAGTHDGAPVASADVLSLDGRAIAVSLNLQVGRTSFAIKCAYDEDHRRFSPGLVLEYLVVEHLFASRFADELDSCVTQGGHVIQDLWDGTVKVGTLALRPRGAGIGVGRLRLDLAEAEQRRAKMRNEAKSRYLAARDTLGSMRIAITGGQEAKAAHARVHLDATSRRAMMTFNAAQPNGEFAAVLATMI